MTEKVQSKDKRGSEILGFKIKKAREDARITKEDFVVHINNNLSNLHKYETGVRRPTIDTLIVIADFFGFSLDYLLRDDYDMSQGPIYYTEKEKSLKSEEKVEWIRKFRNSLKMELRNELIEEIEYDVRNEMTRTLKRNIDSLFT